ncbi:MAG: aminotransferase class IV [Clostridia bacterium]
MAELAYLNGEYMPIESAKVPIEDRGLQFGDSLYEVIRLYGGKPFRSRDHLERMRAGAQVVGFPADALDALPGVIEELASRCGLDDAFVYLQVTRGVYPRVHAAPDEARPTVIATVRAFERLPEEMYRVGSISFTEPDIRWGRRDVKATTLLPNILAATRVQNRGGYDAVLVERDGTVTEGTVSNLFAVIDGAVQTHPLGPRILAGISRKVTLEAAEELDLDSKEEAFEEGDLWRASELFFTNTYCEVLPVVRVDGQPIGDGLPGPVAKRLRKQFRLIVKQETGAN